MHNKLRCQKTRKYLSLISHPPIIGGNTTKVNENSSISAILNLEICTYILNMDAENIYEEAIILYAI